MSERWVKLYAGAMTDEKLLAIAADSGAKRGIVAATWARLLCYAGENHPDTGSVEGFDARRWACWAEEPVELIEAVLASARKFAALTGDIITNWVKRQGRAAVVAESAVRAVASSTRRVRAFRQRKKGVDAQLDLDLSSPAAARGTQETESVTSGVSCVSCSAERKEGKAPQNQNPSLNTESKGCLEVGFENDGGIPFGRDAPLDPDERRGLSIVETLGRRQAAQGKVIKFADSPSVKAKKKELRRQKVVRFITACYAGEDQRIRLEGMFGGDPVHDEQWWFDKCDAERILARWDDVRDKQGPDHWQRLAQ